MITQQLKDAWLKELRDPTNTKTTNGYFEDCTANWSNLDEIRGTKCMCGLGALIKTHANNVPDLKYLGTKIVDCIDAEPQKNIPNFSAIVKMNDYEGKSLAEIADWVEANIHATN